jgi:hypothetical protein
MSSFRLLDFDIENRPLAYWYPGETTAEVTAIAACWMDGPQTMRGWLLGRHKPAAMLKGFRALYDQADMVTGHYIRRHDLPILNGAMLEAGMPALEPKLTCDTKMDLTKRKDISASLEELAVMFGLEARKAHMSNTDWREANRLKPSGIAKAKERATSDVRLHMEIYKRLVDGNYLSAPKVWRP